jgi:hypothetical protein
MSKVLLIFKGNWADEMDIEGFDILSKEHWEFKKLEANNTEFPQEICIGTNENVDYDSVKEYLSDFKVQEISDEEEAIIRKLFVYLPLGQVPYLKGFAPDSFYEKHGQCPQ